MNSVNDTAYWLDLELRADIDDYLTLIYALEQGVHVSVVSIHNPSISELKVLGYALQLFQSSADIVIAGQITEYPADKDIHSSLMNLIDNQPVPHTVSLPVYAMRLQTTPPPVIFCGGSMYTLAKLLQCHPNKQWRACIQGGYAGPSLVGEAHTLDKFKGREQVPTWNLNLDIPSSRIVMQAANLTASFISKNVCHDAWIDKQDVVNNGSVFSRTLQDYFKINTWSSKCMHDLLAFMTEQHPELVTFLPVNLGHTDDKRPKWFSTLNKESNKQISVRFDKEQFLALIREYSPKVQSCMDEKFTYLEIEPVDVTVTSNAQRLTR